VSQTVRACCAAAAPCQHSACRLEAQPAYVAAADAAADVKAQSGACQCDTAAHKADGVVDTTLWVTAEATTRQMQWCGGGGGAAAAAAAIAADTDTDAAAAATAVSESSVH
jgi:hypothetical protein